MDSNQQYYLDKYKQDLNVAYNNLHDARVDYDTFKPIAESGALENEVQIRLTPGTYFVSYYEAVVNRVSKQIKIVLPN